MKKVLFVSILVLLLGVPTATWAFDAGMAKSFDKIFSAVVGPKSGKALHLLSPEVFLKKVVENKKHIILDIRTPDETSVFGMKLVNTMAIPISELFKAENLKKIPTDKNVIMVCSSGLKASAAGTALRTIGFNNVFILKGGLKALSAYMATPKVFAQFKK